MMGWARIRSEFYKLYKHKLTEIQFNPFLCTGNDFLMGENRFCNLSISWFYSNSNRLQFNIQFSLTTQNYFEMGKNREQEKKTRTDRSNLTILHLKIMNKKKRWSDSILGFFIIKETFFRRVKPTDNIPEQNPNNISLDSQSGCTYTHIVQRGSDARCASNWRIHPSICFIYHVYMCN